MVTLNLRQKISKFKIHLTLLAIIATSAILYYPSFEYYFLQDDWFVLNWVKTNSFISYFEFRTDIIYWRPLSMPIFFWLGNKLFALNAFGFHLMAFSFFIALIFMVNKLLSTLFKDKYLALVLTYLYAIWPIHFMSLSWLSTTSYIIGALFQVTSFYYFVGFVEKKRKYYLLISFISFLLALASSELTIALPAVLLSWVILTKKKYLFNIFAPYIIANLVYLVFRFVIFPLPASGTYQIQINYLLIDNYLWYLAWALNLPERFKDLIDQSSVFMSLKIFAQYWQISTTTTIITIILVGRFVRVPRSVKKASIFGFVWFTIGLTPIIFFTNHSFNIYLTFAGLGIIFIIGTLLHKASKILLLAIILTWTLSSIFNLYFLRNSHWIVNEQAISKSLTLEAKKVIQEPKNNSVFVIWPPSSEFSRQHNFVYQNSYNISQSLNFGDAFKVIFGDSTIKTIIVKDEQSFEIPPNVQINYIRPGSLLIL